MTNLMVQRLYLNIDSKEKLLVDSIFCHRNISIALVMKRGRHERLKISWLSRAGSSPAQGTNSVIKDLSMVKYRKINDTDLENCFLMSPGNLWELLKFAWYLYKYPGQCFVFAKLDKDWVKKNLNSKGL